MTLDHARRTVKGHFCSLLGSNIIFCTSLSLSAFLPDPLSTQHISLLSLRRTRLFAFWVVSKGEGTLVQTHILRSCKPSHSHSLSTFDLSRIKDSRLFWWACVFSRLTPLRMVWCVARDADLVCHWRFLLAYCTYSIAENLPFDNWQIVKSLQGLFVHMTEICSLGQFPSLQAGKSVV